MVVKNHATIIMRRYAFYMIIAAIIFTLSFILGYYKGFFIPLPLRRFRDISEIIADISYAPSYYAFFVVFVHIFANNLLTCILNIVLGPLLAFPVFSTVFNGALLGHFVSERGFGFVMRIAPHAIFEIPAFLLSAAIGLRLAHATLIITLARMRSVRCESDDARNVELHSEITHAFRILLTVIIPLLIIAALIESFVAVVTA